MEPRQIPDLEIEISRLISSTFIHLDDGDRLLMKQFGLTTTQYWALVHLGAPEGCSLTDLARLLLCDKSNVTSVVDKLEDADLARRQRTSTKGDRRFTRVVLTEKGQLLRKQAMEAREYIIFTRLHPFGEANLQHLYQVLTELRTLLDDQFDKGDVSALISRATQEESVTH